MPPDPPTTHADRVVHRALAAGRAAFGDLGVTAEAFARQITSRLGPAARLDGAACADLYLALACDLGLSGAWERFVQEFTPRLRGLLRHAGADPSLAEEIVMALPGELLASPGNSGARTRLGTYDGGGSLFGWLAIVALRMLARVRREREARIPVELDAVPATALDPGAAVLAEEAGGEFAAVLRGCWHKLTDQERIAVSCKYGSGVPQEVIARMLGVGPPRVSRILDRALRRIRAAVDASRRSQAAQELSLSWAALRDALASVLATSRLAAPPAGDVPTDHDGPRPR